MFEMGENECGFDDIGDSAGLAVLRWRVRQALGRQRQGEMTNQLPRDVGRGSIGDHVRLSGPKKT